MPTDATERPDLKETVSYSVQSAVVRTIEYCAYVDRSNKSDAMSKLVLAGAAALKLHPPAEAERRSA